MELLEIQSKSFLIKWVTVPEASTVAWQLRPTKKSINFGFFRKIDDTAASSADHSKATSTAAKRRSSVGSASGLIEEKLKKSGLRRIDWHGKCNPDELVRGSYDIAQGGIYAFVFDNTFSKNTSKTIYFSQRVTTGDSVSTNADKSSAASTTKDVVALSRSLPSCISDGRHLSGVLLKKRRKKLQGYARRQFTLDYKYGTLNYYTSENSSILRGSMPIKLSVVSVREKTKEIFIDSGMEVWNLRALNDTDLKTWVAALEVARLGASAIAQHNPQDYAHKLLTNLQADEISNRLSVLLTGTPVAKNMAVSLANASIPRESSEVSVKPIWKDLSQVVEKIETIATKASQHSSNQLPASPKSAPPMLNKAANSSQDKLSVSVDPLDHDVDLSRRKSFWRRRTSRQTSAVSGVAPDADAESAPDNLGHLQLNGKSSNSVLKEISTDLLAVSQQLKTIIQTAKENASLSKRTSFDATSILSEEFFDAEEQGIDGVMYLDADEFSEEDEIELVESRSTSDAEEETNVLPKLSFSVEDSTEATSEAENKNDLYPLTELTSPPKRRNTVPVAVADPPNFLTLIRKNVGKDLSTIAMPVTANEPITILQRFAEMFESTSLIDKGLTYPKDSAERIMHIATFGAVFSASNRVKDRSGRKPFNPLLGETFELVSVEQGMRLLVEKVSHRPLIMAMQAESEGWSIQYAPSPQQNIWGKSVELYNKGTLRLTINSTGEVYEWEQPTTFMRNIIAGEKYTEPVGKLNVVCSNGWRVVYEYKAGGMFSGRSEDMSAKVFTPDGKECMGYELEGKWTTSVSMKTASSTNKSVIWQVGPLVENHHKRFGFTQFAANLNEITDVEREKIAPTDSRLRPDQRAYERGQVDEAQELKLELEQRQRERRTELESSGKQYKPMFFEKQGAEDNWVLKRGKEGYWERRKRGDWNELTDIFYT